MPGYFSDKLLPSVRKGFKLHGKQLHVLEQQGGFKPGGNLAQQVSAGAMRKGDR